METGEEIKEFVESFREKIEPLWSDDLLYEKFKPYPDAHKSAGYCGPSSILLWKQLINKFPNEFFSVAVGKVYSGSKQWIIGKHVWVVWHQGLKTATIIDITADQSKKINSKIIFENIDELAKKDINYIAYKLAQTLNDIDQPPKYRANLLKMRLDSII